MKYNLRAPILNEMDKREDKIISQFTNDVLTEIGNKRSSNKKLPFSRSSARKRSENRNLMSRSRMQELSHMSAENISNEDKDNIIPQKYIVSRKFDRKSMS
jgi:hypothetical protein